MLGKLIKYEFKATAKDFGLLFGALIIMTLLARFCVWIPFDNMVFNMLNALMTIFYFVLVFGLTMFSVVIVVMRFNRSMLRDEGYLTHTLPASKWQILAAKGITYIVWIVASFIMMLVSVFLFFVGTKDFEAFKNSFFDFMDNVSMKLLLLLIVVVVLQMIANLYSFFAALSLGQMFAKHKIAGAVLAYFILNYAMGFLSSGMMMLIPDSVVDAETMAKIETAKTFGDLFAAMDNLIYLLLIFALVANIILTVIYFAISNYVLSKKLNLE